MSSTPNNGTCSSDAETPRAYLARQPIFDRDQKVFGYELLYRSGESNAYDGTDGTIATAKVMINTLMVFGLNTITGGKPALINVNEHLLARNFIELFTPEQIIVEVLEDVQPSAEVLHHCRELKQSGFQLALDDVIDDHRFDDFRSMADIVKVDFMASDESTRAEIEARLLPQGIKLLAEKIETHEGFERARERGYSYFQGYFFAKPELLSKTDLAPNKLSTLRMLQELNRVELSIPGLESVLKGDVGLSYRLLRYINSAQFALRTKVSSLNHALRLLGPQNVRKWAMLISLTSLGNDKPLELLHVALERARFCEDLGELAGLTDYRDDLFLAGMFSLLDAFVDKPRSQLLSELSLSPHITRAILEEKGPIGKILCLVIAYERGDWDAVKELSEHLCITRQALTKCYLEALAWARESVPLDRG